MKIKGAKDYAKYCAAFRAFRNCRYFISLLASEFDGTKRSALWGAACINYRRPFGKNGEFGTIKESLVPPQFKVLHSSLKDQRDDLFAHSNSRAKKFGGRVHEIFFCVKDSTLSIEDQFALPAPGFPEHLDELAALLMKEISEAQDSYFTEHFNDFAFEQGEYILDWDTNKLKKL